LQFFFPLPDPQRCGLGKLKWTLGGSNPTVGGVEAFGDDGDAIERSEV